MNREREIVKGSIYGIIGNALLVAFKMAVGFMSHSIAIILDGVNNATDALSSIVTIVGTKLAGRRPDRHHPFGYGRVEYLTSVVIAIIILVAGFISLRESIDKIIHPGTPSYSAITIIVIVVAILAKIAIGIMFKRFGDKTNSEALIASGIDSNYDAVLSAGTLVVAAAQNFWGLNIDGAVGLIISLVVLKAGFEVLGDALSPLIGGPEDKKLVDDIIAYTNSFPDVSGTYDVVLDNFGPNEVLGSVCAPATSTPSPARSAKGSPRSSASSPPWASTPPTRPVRSPLCMPTSTPSRKATRRSCRCTASTWTRKPRPSTSIWS